MHLAIVGITGKVGKELMLALERSSHTLVSAIASEKNLNIEKVSCFSCPISPLSQADFSKADVIIDFSHASALALLLEKAAFYARPLVIGTTGYNVEDFSLIKKYAEKIPILYSANFSLGILLIKNFISTHLDFFEDALVDIEETHDVSKKDSPSGTSLFLANLFKDKELCLKTPLKRKPQDLVISSFRKHASFGSHKISLDFLGENLTLTHECKNRRVYAIGALKAAEFLQDKSPGLYELSAILENKLQQKV